jgi:hypothetical protein
VTDPNDSARAMPRVIHALIVVTGVLGALNVAEIAFYLGVDFLETHGAHARSFSIPNPFPADRFVAIPLLFASFGLHRGRPWAPHVAIVGMCVWTLGTLNAYAPFGSRSQFSFGSISIRWGQAISIAISLFMIWYFYFRPRTRAYYAAIATKRPADTLAS